MEGRIEKGFRPTIGAIRWDAWSGGDITRQVERSLGPDKYHARMPWFAEVTGPDTISINGGRQDIMDREIGFAAEAGLDYWAFLLYPESMSMSDSLKLYLASDERRRVNFCLILHNAFGVDETQWPRERDRAVALLREPGYHSVLGGRPLVFSFEVRHQGKFPAERFAEFRTAAKEAGSDPYCVFMGWNPAADFPAASALGFDAVSHYACCSDDATFAQLCRRVETDYWQNAAAARVPYVPLATAGWDKNPRKEHPVSWELGQSYHQQVVFPATATPIEIATHLERALNFVDGHPDICPANTVILYSWNEHDEGGWLVPTWTPDGSPNTERLDAIGRMLRGQPSCSVSPMGAWQVAVSVRTHGGGLMKASLPIDPSAIDRVVDELCESLPDFVPDAPGWRKGLTLPGVRAQECTAKFALEPGSLKLSAAPGSGAKVFERGLDYDVDPEWGTVGRLPGGGIAPGQRVYLSYDYGKSRLDSVVLGADGTISWRPGMPHVATPQPPVLAPGEIRLANLFIESRLAALDQAHIFPVLEPAYPEPESPPSPSVAERLLPKSFEKLAAGGALRILAWGDSVTDAGYLPGGAPDRWQEQFAERLRRRFPKADITLVTEAWGGRNTESYLAEPPGSPHNYREKVLGAKPDLIISEFVNDAWLNPEQVEERYARLLADFTGIGAEWIILAPHYVRPDWMGLTRQRDIDEDPRPYVRGLREFAPRHGVALADASRRYGRLWRQGIPYNTLMHNTINHPNAFGMRLFADSLMALFPLEESRTPR